MAGAIQPVQLVVGIGSRINEADFTRAALELGYMPDFEIDVNGDLVTAVVDQVMRQVNR